jgi:2-polyprenyl-3-methyl-5-hydroxy-6-metoxy-1,4-benzoquinol methylase
MQTNFETAQEIWRSTLNLQKSELDQIEQQLPHPKYADFIYNSDLGKSNNLSVQWQIESYNNIKDSLWPECLTSQDLKNLPLHIIEECKNTHGLDFLIYEASEIDQTRWNQHQSGVWPVWELIRYKHIILDLKQYLQNKTVLDYAAHAGITSLIALQVGAKFITTTNVRPEYVKLADKMLSLSMFKDKYKTALADLHDYQNNTKICQGVDTVLLYGVMYHVHDHCEILDSITDAKPETIIIDNYVLNSIIDSDVPTMQWVTERTEDVWNGWVNGHDIIPVGLPNFAWFVMYMQLKNYQSVYYKKYFTTRDVDPLLPPTEQRCIMVFERSV